MKQSQCETCKYLNSFGDGCVRCNNPLSINEDGKMGPSAMVHFEMLYAEREHETGQGYFKLSLDGEDCCLYEPVSEPEIASVVVTKTRLDLSKWEKVQ